MGSATHIPCISRDGRSSETMQDAIRSQRPPCWPPYASFLWLLNKLPPGWLNWSAHSLPTVSVSMEFGCVSVGFPAQDPTEMPPGCLPASFLMVFRAHSGVGGLLCSSGLLDPGPSLAGHQQPLHHRTRYLFKAGRTLPYSGQLRENLTWNLPYSHQVIGIPCPFLVM